MGLPSLICFSCRERNISPCLRGEDSMRALRGTSRMWNARTREKFFHSASISQHARCCPQSPAKPLGSLSIFKHTSSQLPTPASLCQKAALRLKGACSVQTDSSKCLEIYVPLERKPDRSGGINMNLVFPVQDSRAPSVGLSQDCPMGCFDNLPLLSLTSILLSLCSLNTEVKY